MGCNPTAHCRSRFGIARVGKLPVQGRDGGGVHPIGNLLKHVYDLLMNLTTNQPSLNRAASITRAPISLAVCCAIAVFFVQTPRSWAQEDGSPEVIAVDVLIVRPLCLAATVIGATLFLVSLPISVASNSTSETGRKLVGLPARATFTRRLGDMTSLANR